MLKRRNTNQKFIVWMSDCDLAFQNLPVCFQQQIRQVICSKKKFYIDCCINFGSSAPPRIWCSYFSLILWTAWSEIGIDELKNYMEDNWGISLQNDIVQFKDRCVPLNQAKFLTLFEYLSIPRNWEKQVHSSGIEVIGHWIDSKAMTISLSDDKRLALATELEKVSQHLSQPLIQWSQSTGWADWGINIFPLGRWALQLSWDKIAGKTIRNAHVPLNLMTCANLQWLSKALLKWERRQLLDLYFCKIDSADAAAYVQLSRFSHHLIIFRLKKPRVSDLNHFKTIICNTEIKDRPCAV